jgi:hypothetical protein
MNYLQIQDLINNAEFRKRISSAISVAATNISGEDPTSVGGQGSTWSNKRHALATGVLRDNQGYTKVFSINSATQPGLNTVIEINPDGSLNYIGGNSLDQDIEYTVSSIWDDTSGVSYDDKNPV